MDIELMQYLCILLMILNISEDLIAMFGCIALVLEFLQMYPIHSNAPNPVPSNPQPVDQVAHEVQEALQHNFDSLPLPMENNDIGEGPAGSQMIAPQEQQPQVIEHEHQEHEEMIAPQEQQPQVIEHEHQEHEEQPPVLEQQVLNIQHYYFAEPLPVMPLGEWVDPPRMGNGHGLNHMHEGEDEDENLNYHHFDPEADNEPPFNELDDEDDDDDDDGFDDEEQQHPPLVNGHGLNHMEVDEYEDEQQHPHLE